MRDPVGNESPRIAEKVVGVASPPGQQLLIASAHPTDEHPADDSLRVRAHSGVLAGLPGQLERDPLVRIHEQRGARRDTKQICVEASHVVEVAAGISEATLLRSWADRITSFEEE